MKKIIFFFIMAIALLGFNACSKTDNAGVSAKTCFPIYSWKIKYAARNEDCADCHTVCAISPGHTCKPETTWTQTEVQCLTCHNGKIAPQH